LIRHAGPGVGQAMAAAVIGGTAAVIGGGKFANGAISGAWVNLFNDQGRREEMVNPLVDLWRGLRFRIGGYVVDDPHSVGLKQLPQLLADEARSVPFKTLEAIESQAESMCTSGCVGKSYVYGEVSSLATQGGFHLSERGTTQRFPALGGLFRLAARLTGPLFTMRTIVQFPDTIEACRQQCLISSRGE
jgi:hypothetical protein